MDEILDKIEQISAQECAGLSRIPFDLLIGYCSHVFDKAGIPHTNPIPEEYFDAVIYGIYDELYDGFEPEFETEEEYNRYEETISKLKKCEYMLEETVEKTNFFGQKYMSKIGNSPYQDKTIPFLGLKHDI